MTVAVVGILYIKAFNKKTLREQNNERHTSIFVDDDVTLCCLTHDFAHTIRVRRNDNHADPDPIMGPSSSNHDPDPIMRMTEAPTTVIKLNTP